MEWTIRKELSRYINIYIFEYINEKKRNNRAKTVLIRNNYYDYDYYY